MNAPIKLLKSGRRFGRLKIVRFSRTINYRSAFLCQCDCGKLVEVKREKLVGGTTFSCGCYAKERASGQLKEQATTHGLSYTSDYKRISNFKRRALTLAAEGSHTVEDVLDLKISQNNRCFYCRNFLSDYHVDHKIPLSRGGSNYKINLCIACPTCNMAKHNKTDIEFLVYLENKTKERFK